jgi:hypothetical protein
MSVQGVECSAMGERLALRWELFAKPNAVSVCIAHNSEFTDTMRHFVLPAVTSVQFDTGPGSWYVRIGAWNGTAQSGAIEWSGIYGPVSIVSHKPVVPTVPMKLPILHQQAIQNGMRFFTSVSTPYYVLFESSTTNTFTASSTKYTYVLDNGRGQVDCGGLDPNVVYSLRISTLYPDMSRFPTDSIQQINVGRALHGIRCARPLRYPDTTAIKSGNAILNDSKHKPHMRFASHSDYLKFQAAKARTGEQVTRILP